MRIVNLYVENFRQFKDGTNIPFEKVTSIVWKNGEWKTTILDAISYATNKSGNFKIKEQDFNIENPFSDIKICVTFDSAFIVEVPAGFFTRFIPSIEVELIIKHRSRWASGRAFNDSYVTQQTAVPLIYTQKSTIIDLIPSEFTDKIPDALKEEDGAEHKYSLPQKNGQPFKFDSRSLQLGWQLQKFPNVFYFEKNREKILLKSYNSTFSKIIEDLNWRFLKNLKDDAKKVDTYNAMLNALHSLVISTVEEEKNDRVLYPLIEKMKGFFVNDSKYEGLELSISDRKNPFDDSFFSIRNGTSWEQIMTDNLGSGESTILAYYLFKIVSRLSKEEVIFLIDEPELHLHPQWQEKLRSEFESDTEQIVYTTHSPFLVNLWNWKSIKRVCGTKISPNYASLSSLAEDGKPISSHLDDMEKYYQNRTIFFREDTEMLFADSVILAEWPVEKTSLPQLFRLYGIPESPTIVSCNGKWKICHYQIFAKAFDINYFTLFDLDWDPVTESGNDCILKNASGISYAYSQSFESEFWVWVHASHKATATISTVLSLTSKTSFSTEVSASLEKIKEWLTTNPISPPSPASPESSAEYREQ